MLGLMSLPILAFFILPLIALFLRITPGEFLAYLNQTQVIQAVLLSLFTTVAATLVSIVLGTPLAYAIGRGCFRYPRLVDTLIDLPLVLPPAVAGVALLMTFGRRGLLGGALDLLGIQIPFTPLAVVMAQTFVSASFYIRSAALGFSSIDPELEQAAGLDGASNWQTFRFVIVPLSWTALLSGGVMTWARALGEFGATIIFAGNYPGRTQTMPLAIYIGFELDLNVALILSVILVGFSFLALFLIKGLLRRG
jgi:molybdate transport system permease protein